MDSLSEQLKALGVKLGAQSIPVPQPEEKYPIDKVVPGKVLSTIYGEVYATEENFSSDYIQGSCQLHVQHPMARMAEWSHIPALDGMDPERFLFLDIETTGLAGGTGTFAFLVGVGQFIADEFKLTQFFLRDPSEELPLLAALSEKTDPQQVIVSFNGRSFDVPLLNTRYTLHAISSPFSQLAHLDLLPLARRLWRDRLPSRALGYLEKEILGMVRAQEEVPGWLVPQLYFDYLRSFDTRPLAGVFYHNAMDIVSLAALLNYTNGMLAEPLSKVEQPGLDLVALGKLYEDMDYRETAIQLYESGMDRGLPEEHYWKTVERYATLYKHEQKWDKAVTLWEKAAAHGDLYAFIEIAKYYEHYGSDVDAALFWTQSAIECLNSGAFPGYLKHQLTPEFQHRLQRLEAKKLNRASSSPTE